MVSYEQWVSIARSVADRKGARLDEFEKNSELISLAADIWNDRKQELQNASKSQAKNVADEEISVR